MVVCYSRDERALSSYHRVSYWSLEITMENKCREHNIRQYSYRMGVEIDEMDGSEVVAPTARWYAFRARMLHIDI